MKKKRKVVSKKDWIIIRLLVVALRNGLHNDPEVTKSVFYIGDKYGLNVIGHCSALIRADREVTHGH